MRVVMMMRMRMMIVLTCVCKIARSIYLYMSTVTGDSVGGLRKPKKKKVKKEDLKRYDGGEYDENDDRFVDVSRHGFKCQYWRKM